jgi:adiponectin receptor
VFAKHHRSLVFTALAASGIAPLLHISPLLQGRDGLRNFSVRHIATTCSCYAVGMTIYVARVPERLFPGVFDIWVCSICLLIDAEA